MLRVLSDERDSSQQLSLRALEEPNAALPSLSRALFGPDGRMVISATSAGLMNTCVETGEIFASPVNLPGAGIPQYNALLWSDGFGFLFAGGEHGVTDIYSN